jgi:GNAT superfamily N-acetyltransferase
VLVAETTETTETTPNTLVGVCYAQIKPDDWFTPTDSYGYVGCVFVEEKYRGGGRGVWQKMHNQLEQWFKAKEQKQLRLECYYNNHRYSIILNPNPYPKPLPNPKPPVLTL